MKGNNHMKKIKCHDPSIIAIIGPVKEETMSNIKQNLMRRYPRATIMFSHFTTISATDFRDFITSNNLHACFVSEWLDISSDFDNFRRETFFDELENKGYLVRGFIHLKESTTLQ